VFGALCALGCIYYARLAGAVLGSRGNCGLEEEPFQQIETA
jgi:hypothetical protein